MKRTVFIEEMSSEILLGEVGEYDSITTYTGDKAYPQLDCALVPCGFDIEAYKQFMYIWTFTVKELTIVGYTWEDFLSLMRLFKDTFKLGKRLVKTVKHRDGTVEVKYTKPYVFPVYVHNLKYEYAFMKYILTLSGETFFMDKGEKNPLYLIHDESILFIDSFKVYPMSLEEVAHSFCKTQKSHDLEYSKPRNLYDAMTLSEKELDYCVRDTQILSELMQYTFNKYVIPYGRIPFTQNQIIRSIIHANGGKEGAKNYTHLTLSQDDYLFIRDEGFRGGWCQSSEQDVEEDIRTADLTSAYFAAIMHGYYPMDKYEKPMITVTKENLDYFTDMFCCQMQIKFYNLEAKGNKLVKYDTKEKVTVRLPDGRMPKTDAERKEARESVRTTRSGRIWKAACIVVSLTEIDWEIYKEIYTWSDFDIEYILISTRGKLPEYIRKTALMLYERKAALKKSGMTGTPEYIQAKTLVSTIFGCMVKRVSESVVDGDEKSWWAKTCNLELKPQWGVYVSAHVRKTIIDMVLKLGRDRWLYSDTDSIYYIYDQYAKKLFDEYNSIMREKNKAMCEEYGLDLSLFDDLGCFDGEGKQITHFKTLGTKTYLYWYTDKKYPSGNFKLVLSGIPADDFWKSYYLSKPHDTCIVENKDKYVKEVFDFFDYDSIIYYTRHLCDYIDDETTEVINGTKIVSKSGCVISESTTKGTLSNIREVVAYEEFAENLESDDLI